MYFTNWDEHPSGQTDRFEQMLTNVVTKQDVAEIILPKGVIALDRKVVLDVPDYVSSVVIHGYGCELTSVDPDIGGMLEINLYGRTRVVINGLTLNNPTDATAYSGTVLGTLLKITDTLDGVYDRGHQVVLNDLQIGSQDGNKSQIYTAIELVHIQYPLINNVTIRNYVDYDKADDWATKLTKFTGSGILFTNCYWPRVMNSRIDGPFTYGIWHFCTTQEQFTFRDNEIHKSRYGIRVEHDGYAASAREPGGGISGGHIKGLEVGVWLSNCRGVQITAIDIGLVGGAADVYATNPVTFRLTNCERCRVHNVNHLEGNGEYTSDSDCYRFVELDGGQENTISENFIAVYGIGIVNDVTGNLTRSINNTWIRANSAITPSTRVQNPNTGVAVQVDFE